MAKCPKCGAGEDASEGTFACGTRRGVNATVKVSNQCLRRQLAAANERAGRLEANLRSLCERLDEWWYEADPMGDVKKGERHPWTVAARKALEVPDAL